MILWLFACTQNIELGNREWIKEVLYEDNWRYLQRSPIGLEQKFRAMSGSEYAFMRGSLSIQLRHWSRQSQERRETGFLNIPAATMVPIFGDAHPENFTIAAHPSQPVTTEFIDLDASSFAPWIIDVRRALTAQRVFASSMEGCDVECQNELVIGWVEGFQACLQGADCSILESQIIEDLIVEAFEEGDEQQKYNKYTTDGSLDFDDALNEEGKGIFPVSSGDQTPQLVFRQFADSRQGVTRLLDVGQRFGMGVSSRPALRYVFVWDTGLDGEEDNELLIAREVFDAPDYHGRLGIETEPFESNAHRVVRMRQLLWTNPSADPNYTFVQRPFDFKTQSWTSYYQDVEVSKIQEDWNDGTLNVVDLTDLASVMGSHHALVWRSTNTLQGRNSGLVIQEDIGLGGGFEVFTSEMLSVSDDDYQVLQADYQWFQRELERTGPLLGLDAMGGW